LADKKLLFEGSIKRIFGNAEDDQVIQEFLDEAVTGNKKQKVKNKGKMANTISSALFEYMEGYNIPTYYIGKAGDAQMSVRNVEGIPVNVIVRNIAAGSFCDRYNVDAGTVLKFPIVEYFLKDEKIKENQISESYIYAMDYASPDEVRHISRLVIKINAVLKDYFERRDINLVDFKVTFGRSKNQLFLADEILPDNCRLWDLKSEGDPGSKRFSLEKGNAADAYKEIFHRITGE